MEIDSLLTNILDSSRGNVFYQFSNADGKRWVMPARNMRVAMNLYQPSGRNGKLVKTLFPLLHGFSAVRRVIHAEKLCCRLVDELDELLCSLFKQDKIEYSIFCGTPSVHQKITMQVSRGQKILGYVKFTESDEIAQLFKREAEYLNNLQTAGLTSVPHSLYSGEWTDGVYLFVQSTVKSQNSKVLHNWGPLHDEFLKELEARTLRRIQFEDSDYYYTLNYLKEHLDWLPTENGRVIVDNAIDKIFDSYRGKQVDFSAYHADFTPWNMFVEKGKLFVFDWEYAQLTYPQGLDRYHFFTQTAIFEKHLDAYGIWELYKQNRKLLPHLSAEQNDFTYLCYLIGIIAHYVKRDKTEICGSMANVINLWISLISKLISQQ